MDWHKFREELDELVANSGTRTDRNVATKISSITRLTEEEVKKFFPDPGDAKKLAELLEIVRRSGDRDAKTRDIVANAERFGGVLLTLVDKLA